MMKALKKRIIIQSKNTQPLLRETILLPDQMKRKKMIILDESNERFTGRLKFFDENKNYGFIIMDQDGTDIFVHYDDLAKADISKEFLRSVKVGNNIRFSFNSMRYLGKYNQSRKAVDLQLIQ